MKLNFIIRFKFLNISEADNLTHVFSECNDNHFASKRIQIGRRLAWKWGEHLFPRVIPEIAEALKIDAFAYRIIHVVVTLHVIVE